MALTPSKTPPASNVIVTVSGPDRPGITATLTGILAQMNSQLLDIEQVVVQGHLSLGMLVSIRADPGVLKELLFAARELGVSLDFKPVDGLAPPPPAVTRYVVTAIGPNLGAGELHALSRGLADHDGNIAKISRLSLGNLRSVEMQVDLPRATDPKKLQEALLGLAMRSSFDVALQREGLFRRSKRLVVMDMDSTLIPIEVIDELARAHGVAEQVAAVTERAMAGEMDYDVSLRSRAPHPGAEAARLPYCGDKRRVFHRRGFTEGPARDRLRLLEYSRGEGGQAHR
jgi:phosphoserine phosphatase